MKKLTNKEIREAAEVASDVTAEHIAEGEWGEDYLITYDDLLAMSGFPAPPMKGNRDEFRGWELAWMQMKETYREMVSRKANRYLRTAPKEGFAITAPGETVSYVEDRCYDWIRNRLAKGQQILRHVRDDELTIEQRQEKVAAQIRLSQVQGQVKQAAMQAEKQRSYRDTPSKERPTIPSVGAYKDR